MTTITIDRELLEQALVALSAPNHCVFSEPPICVDIRAALAAPATAPEPVAWLAHYVGRSGMEQEYVSTDKNLADENDASGKALPLYLHPPATAPAQPEIVDLLAEMYELILANKVVLAEKSGGVWTWPDRAIEAVRKHRSGPAQPERKPMTPDDVADCMFTADIVAPPSSRTNEPRACKRHNAKVSGAGTAPAGLPGWQANGETE